MTSQRIAVVILAAGEGKRLRSKLPKVLHRAAGKPLLVHAIESARGVQGARVVVVTSSRIEEIRAEVEGFGHKVDFVVQDPPRGTGDAVKVAMGQLAGEADVVVVTNGDVPLLTGESLTDLVTAHLSGDAAATMMTTDLPGSDLGRVIRAASGEVEKIVEVRDATPGELQVAETNAGIYAFDAPVLDEMLERLTPDNAQGEYYLTDVVGLLRSAGHTVQPHRIEPDLVLGVNDRVQLAAATEALYRRTAERWMREGVTIVDPSSTFIDTTVTIESDATIMPFTFLEGTTSVAAGAVVGPQCRLIDTSVGPGAEVTYAVARSSDIGPEASVGPFASLRPGTVLERKAKLGTFVESKNSHLGEGSKANHLAYLGDAELGTNVNVGAGTITCNWDGKQKHKTVIDDDAYISSDTMLVAPVRIGKRAATGAGAVVKDDVPDDALAVGVPARIIEGKGNRMKHD